MKSNVVVSLPPQLMAQLEDMAHERDMPMNAMVSELVHLGILSLKTPVRPIQDSCQDQHEETEYPVHR